MTATQHHLMGMGYAAASSRDVAFPACPAASWSTAVANGIVTRKRGRPRRTSVSP